VEKKPAILLGSPTMRDAHECVVDEPKQSPGDEQAANRHSRNSEKRCHSAALLRSSLPALSSMMVIRTNHDRSA